MKKLFVFFLTFTVLSMVSQNMYKISYNYTDLATQQFESDLFTNNKEAVFKIYDSRERGTLDLPDGKVTFVENDELSRFFYANLDKAYARTISYGEEVLYEDNYKAKLDWKINTQKKKKIHNYDCVEAKVKINQRSYTVYFTMDVPIQFGPLKLHGLPGMVVEVNEDSGFLKLTLSGVDKKVDEEEFNLYKNYFKSKKDILSYFEYENKVIDDTTSAVLRGLTHLKKINLERNSNLTLTYDYNMFADKYLEYPPNLISELKKVK